MYEPCEGCLILLDSSRRGWAPLRKCDDWDRAAFRFPNPIPEWRWKHAIACNVVVTGRTPQHVKGILAIRVRIEWPGDCEPDTHGGGWMMLKDWNTVAVADATCMNSL